MRRVTPASRPSLVEYPCRIARWLSGAALVGGTLVAGPAHADATLPRPGKNDGGPSQASRKSPPVAELPQHVSPSDVHAQKPEPPHPIRPEPHEVMLGGVVARPEPDYPPPRLPEREEKLPPRHDTPRDPRPPTSAHPRPATSAELLLHPHGEGEPCFHDGRVATIATRRA